MPVHKENQRGAAAPTGSSTEEEPHTQPKPRSIHRTRPVVEGHQMEESVPAWRKERLIDKCCACPELSPFAVGAMITTGRM